MCRDTQPSGLQQYILNEGRDVVQTPLPSGELTKVRRYRVPGREKVTSSLAGGADFT